MDPTEPSTPVHISFLMDLPTYLDARLAFLDQRFHPAMQWSFRWATRLMAVLLIYIALFMPVQPGEGPGGHVVLVVLATMMLIYGPAIRASWRWQYSKQMVRDTKIAFTFDPEVVALWTPILSQTARWEIYKRLVETRLGFLLYVNAVSFHWLPRSAFEPHAREQFVAIAREHIPYKLSRR